MAIIAAIWAKFWPYVALIGGVLAGLFAVRQSGKAAGKAEVVAKINQEQAQARKEADHVESQVAQMDDDAVRNRAAEWVRGPDR